MRRIIIYKEDKDIQDIQEKHYCFTCAVRKVIHKNKVMIPSIWTEEDYNILIQCQDCQQFIEGE